MTYGIQWDLRFCAPPRTEGATTLFAHDFPQLESRTQTKTHLSIQYEPRSEQPIHKLSFFSLHVVSTVTFLARVRESSILTFNIISSSPVGICAGEECPDVFSGPFTVFLDIPLSFTERESYIAFAFSRAWHLLASDENVDDDRIENDGEPDKRSYNAMESETREDAYKRRNAGTNPLMFALSAAWFVFTARLAGHLEWVIRGMCSYSLTSAALSTSLFVLTEFVCCSIPTSRPALTISTVFTAVVASAASTTLVASGLADSIARPPDGNERAPFITAHSKVDAMQIATNLAGKHSAMIDVYCRSHCYIQELRFKKKVFGMVLYTERDKPVVNSQKPP